MADTDALPGTPCWIDLVSTDIARARAFHEEIFGWTAGEASPEFGGYFMFSDGDAPVAGGQPVMEGDKGPSRWQVFLRSNDITATIARVGAAAGEVVAGPMTVANLGTLAMVMDATAALVGVWQADTFTGFTPGADGPGHPIWFELHAKDYDSATAFYEAVFDWKSEEMPQGENFRYRVASHDGTMFAGIFDTSTIPSDGVGSHWEVYFAVADVDSMVVAIENLGGATLMAPTDSPFGRLALVADPTGAVFRVIAR